jgi:hypothetical protein
MAKKSTAAPAAKTAALQVSKAPTKSATIKPAKVVPAKAKAAKAAPAKAAKRGKAVEAAAGAKRGRKSKINAAQVKDIRKDYGSMADSRSRRAAKGDVTYATLAAKYDVSRVTIHAVLHNIGAYAA